MRLINRLTATTLATALALTSFTAAPARADGEDVAKVLAGVATLFILSQAISSNRKDDDRATTRRNAPDHGAAAPRANHPGANHSGNGAYYPRNDDRRNDNWRNEGSRNNDQRVDNWPNYDQPSRNIGRPDRNPARPGNEWRYRTVELPQNCASSYTVRNGHENYYGVRCLQQSGISNPPERCFQKLRNEYDRIVAGERCLIENGYHVEARRR